MQKLVLFLTLLIGIGAGLALPKLVWAESAHEGSVMVGAYIEESITYIENNGRLEIVTNVHDGAQVELNGKSYHGRIINLPKTTTDSVSRVFVLANF